MKYFFVCISVIFFIPKVTAQIHFKIHTVKLPPDVGYFNNQYSSLYIYDHTLYLMSESRLEDNAEAFLTSVDLSGMEKAIDDSSYQPVFTKIPVYGLDVIRKKMQAEKQSYEGLEAVAIIDKTVYLSIETATPDDYCFLVKGCLQNNTIHIDTSKMLHLAKPLDSSGEHIYNAGYESLESIGNQLYAFYEYNYFPEKNYAVCIDTSLTAVRKIGINKWPFRITDVTRVPETNSLVGINFFFSGGGKDEIYRVPPVDTANYPLTRTDSGFRSYCRLVKIDFDGNKFFCRSYASLPESYWGYNWEGLAEYKNGFFIINDKYTPSRPYHTTLSYLEIKNDNE